MTDLQLSLTRLIGKKELTFGCFIKNKFGQTFRIGDVKIDKKKVEIIGHPATLTDLHRWMNEKKMYWRMEEDGIDSPEFNEELPYDSSKDLLEQELSTLEQIIFLIKENGNK